MSFEGTIENVTKIETDGYDKFPTKKCDFPILWSIGGRLFILADLWLGIESGAQN